MRAEHEQEFTAFVAAVSGRLVHAGDLLTGSRARGEDLVQHGLAMAYSRWTSIRLGNPEAYVRTTMLNRYLDWWRRLRWRELPLSGDEDDDLAGHRRAADPADQIARRDAVQRALAQLTTRERAVIVMRYWLDLSEVQIAQELRIAPGTVKSTAARALTRLRASNELTTTQEAYP